MADHLLDVIARPARRGDRIAAENEGVDADRESPLSSSPWTKFLAPARLRISAAAAAPSSLATTTDPLRRLSLPVHSAICQSLTAVAIAALRSWLRMPWPTCSGHSTPSATLLGSRCCFCMNDSEEPCWPPSGG